ncbi:MAG: FAD-dependent monooxygenase [Chloroflexota bacterium]
MAKRYQVIMVGGGPVGVALAVELGLRGISCAVVERYQTPLRIPKGQGLTQRTLEHFYFWGIDEELRAAKVRPSGYPIGSITAYGDLMSEYWYRPPGREVVRDYYFQDNERLPQYLMEEVLRARLRDCPSVDLYIGWRGETVEQDDSSARVTIVKSDSGEQQVLKADYIVGCDGAHSTVRDQLGIDRGGADYDTRMVLAVLRSRELHEGLKRFPEGTTYRVLDPALKGYWKFFGRVDVGESFFFHAPVPKDTTVENFDFHGLVQEAAGFKFACEFDHVGFWDLRIAVASRYRQGRVFIAGDAAHSHPPYGGFGLNSGLEDVTNLGWKLAAALEGWGSEALLDSYSEERRPIFVETGQAMIAGWIEKDREFLERYSPEKDRAEFEREWSKMADAAGRQQQSYEPHYEGSSVMLGPADGVCSIHGRYSYTAQAGHHLTPQLLSSGRNVYEELGPWFTLLAFGAQDQVVQAFQKQAESLNVSLKIVRDSYADGRTAYEAPLILVRPDQYIVWTGEGASADLSGVLRRVTGRN